MGFEETRMSQGSNENRLVVIGVSTAIVIALAAGTIISRNRAEAMRAEAEKAHAQIAEWDMQDVSELMKKPVPDFRFESTAGRPIGLEDLAGHVWVGAFVFSRCPNNMCPDICRSLQELQKRTGDVPEDLRLVAFSVDPEHDTIEKLKEWGTHYDADFSRWYFLRGDLEKVHALAHDGFRLGSGKNVQDHSGKLVLVDADGLIRGYFDGTGVDRDAEVRTLERAARELIMNGGR